MLSRHQDALKKSVMLGHASVTSWLMQNVHDKLRLFQTQTYLHFIRHDQSSIRANEQNSDTISNANMSGSGRN